MGFSRFFNLPRSRENRSLWNASSLNTRLFSLLSLLLFAIHPVSSQDQAANSEAQVVRGTVINSITREPIPRALVTSTDERFAALTDSSGHFEFTIPKAQDDTSTSVNGGFFRSRLSRGSELWLNARKPGFLSDQDRSLPSVVDKDNVISLVPEAIIKGHVNLSTGDPAAGVSVQIYSHQVVNGLLKWTRGAVTRTNSEGEFRFAELARDNYKISTLEFSDADPQAAIPGDERSVFPPAYFPGGSDFGTGANINLQAGQTIEADLLLTLQRYYPIRIPVVGNEANADLQVAVQGPHGPGFALGYNAAERRIEGSLPNGTYVVEATSYNPLPSTGLVNLSVQGGPTDGPVLSLVLNVSIPVEVKEEFNNKVWNGSVSMSIGGRYFSIKGPRRYLNVSAESADDFARSRGGAMRPPTGPNDDAIELENLSPGKYWIYVNTSRGYVASATCGSTDLLREPLRVVSGANSPIEITLRDDGAALDGTIGNSSEQPATIEPGATVYLIPLPDSSGQFQQTGISPDGKFELQNLAPGSYRVVAFATSRKAFPYRDAESMKAWESKGQVVRLTAGQKTSMQISSVEQGNER